MNTIQLIGRLTKEVELKATSNGTAVGTFTLAVNRNFTNQQGEREADFIMCQIWRKAAENLAQFTRKGSQIGITGRLQTRNYENQQGQRVYVTEVVVDQFDLLEPKSQNNSTNQPFNQQGNVNTCQQQNNAQNGQNFNQNGYGNFEYVQPVDIAEDDLPF